MGHKQGLCNICGLAAKLTDDHVPPLSVVPAGDVEVRRLAGAFGAGAADVLRVQGAATFRTICPVCNNVRLGESGDPALVAAATGFRAWVSGAFDFGLSLPREAPVGMQPALVMRAVFGHLLAADGARESRTDMAGGSTTDAMRQALLSEVPIEIPGVALVVWAYPSRVSVVARGCGCVNLETHRLFTMDVLKFFPFGFGVVPTDQLAAVPFPVARIETGGMTALDEYRTVRIPLWNVPRANWPEVPASPWVSLLHNKRFVTATPVRPAA